MLEKSKAEEKKGTRLRLRRGKEGQKWKIKNLQPFKLFGKNQ